MSQLKASLKVLHWKVQRNEVQRRNLEVFVARDLKLLILKNELSNHQNLLGRPRHYATKRDDNPKRIFEEKSSAQEDEVLRKLREEFEAQRSKIDEELKRKPKFDRMWESPEQKRYRLRMEARERESRRYRQDKFEFEEQLKSMNIPDDPYMVMRTLKKRSFVTSLFLSVAKHKIWTMRWARAQKLSPIKSYMLDPTLYGTPWAHLHSLGMGRNIISHLNSWHRILEAEEEAEYAPYGVRRNKSPFYQWEKLTKKRERRPENLYSPFEELGTASYMVSL